MTSIGVAITCEKLEHKPPATKKPRGPKVASMLEGDMLGRAAKATWISGWWEGHEVSVGL